MSNDEQGTVSTTGELVVVGSSAGGVEALSVFVSTLPKDFPAPIVLAQHLDPNRPSTLDLILKQRTPLPVEAVTSTTKLEPGKIYVVPANRHVSIHDSHVEVQEDPLKRTRPRPSVDMLLSTAAEAYGDRLIAVILTGSGSDGTAGAVDVKNAGGTVIAQDPQTARYPSMPLSLPPTVVDFEIKIEDIGPLLYDLLTGVRFPSTEEKTEDILRNILELVGRQASIDFRPYKTTTILRRISRRMAITHNRTMRDYSEYLEAHPEEIGELVKAFLINVTQFFRDPDAFVYLRSEVLPKLIARARERDHVLRFWTAGCSTGEEPYSLAMLVTDLLGAELSNWSVKIFATDLDEAAINFARRGLYTENLLKGVPIEYHNRFFERADSGYRISKTLRQMVIFGQQDLSRSAPFPHLDLVLCRNVLIYFTPELQEYVLNQFAFSLSPHGYLFLGKAETVRPNQFYYEMVNKHWKIYHCIDSSLIGVRRPGQSELSLPRLEARTTNRSARLAGKSSNDGEAGEPVLELRQLRHFNELLLRFLPIGVVVIDRSYRVLTANGAARRLLGLRDMGNEQDFLHAVRGIPYSYVRNAIDVVFRERNSATLPEVELDITMGGSGRVVSLAIGLMQVEAGAPDLAAISVTDVTEQVQIRRQLEAVQSEQAQLMNELTTANKRLNDVNKDLLDANEELQVANEELVLTHEELQATIEEFETTNEELQATNEELETNNEELQATNEELETTNDELRARTVEQQELTHMLESERIQLTEMVELAPFYIMVLRGPHLVVEAFNPRYARLLEGQLIQGQPLAVTPELLWDGDVPIMRLAREAYQQDTVRTTSRMLTRLPKAQGGVVESYFVYTIVPSHDADGKVSGVIIYAVDETEQRAREAEEEREKLRSIFDNTNMIALALFDARTAELIMASPRYFDITVQTHDLARKELIGRKWQELTFVASGDEAAHIWNTVIESRTPMRIPEVHLTLNQDSQEATWDWSLIPILDNQKKDTIRYMLVSAIEVTEQVQARQEVEQLDHLKDDFLSLASHELRSPLTSILGNTQLLQRHLKRQAGNTSTTSSEVAEQEMNLVNAVIHQVNRMSRLIDEMLDLTRIRTELFEMQNRENVNIVELVQRIVESLSAANNRSITLENSTDQQTIVGNWDESRLEQVVTNLISNALKYSPPDKPVVVGIDLQQENAHPHEVVVWVRDEGPGISPDQQKHIFDRFFRAPTPENSHIEGLGLGLYITHEIITQQGGKIWLNSTLGQGSTFYFSLPL